MCVCVCVWSVGEGSSVCVGSSHMYKINLHEIKSCEINPRVCVCVCVYMWGRQGWCVQMCSGENSMLGIICAVGRYIWRVGSTECIVPTTCT